MTIYYFENVSYVYKGWDAVFKEVVESLKQTHAVEIKHKTNHPAVDGTYFYIEEFNYRMRDCELIIYDEENDILRAVSFSESYTDLWNIFVSRNNKNDLLLVTQFDDWFNRELETGKLRIDLSQYNFTVGETVFYTLLDTVNYENLYAQRCATPSSELEDKMFMLFTTQRGDPYTLAELGYLNKDLVPCSTDEYFKKALGYKIGLAVATVAEYAYREIEYMAIGIPFMRVEYLRQLNPPLIPNYHYIAVDRAKNGLPYNSGLDRVGGEQYVQAYIDRFLEVKDDKEFLDFIVKNAREYYLKYCGPQNRKDHMLTLLKLN